MKISEVQPGMTNVTLKVKVKSIGPIRDVNTRYGKQTVANAVIEDDSGEAELSLWGKQIEEVQEGKEIEITNGFAREWNNKVQISVGKMGEMKIL